MKEIASLYVNTVSEPGYDPDKDAYILGYSFQARIPGISRDMWISRDISSSWSEMAFAPVRVETWHRTKLASS
jgi:hypothetical protein